MDKHSLTQAVAEATKMTQKTASLAIDAITQSLKAGDPVTLMGFGSFKAKKDLPVLAVSPVQGRLSRSLQQQCLPSAPVNP